MVRVIYRRASHAAALLPLCFARISKRSGIILDRALIFGVLTEDE